MTEVETIRSIRSAPRLSVGELARRMCLPDERCQMVTVAVAWITRCISVGAPHHNGPKLNPVTFQLWLVECLTEGRPLP